MSRSFASNSSPRLTSRRAVTAKKVRSRPSHAHHLGLTPGQARLVVPVIALCLLVVGALTSIALVSQSQELRQQASTVTMGHGGGKGTGSFQPAAKPAPQPPRREVEKKSTECLNDQRKCTSGSTTQTQLCKDGQWVNDQLCGSGQKCEGGSCVSDGASQLPVIAQNAPKCDDLPIGAQRCVGGSVQTCIKDLSDATRALWSSERCLAGKVCRATGTIARCVDAIRESTAATNRPTACTIANISLEIGEQRCTQGSKVWTCQPDGNMSSPVNCQADEECVQQGTKASCQRKSCDNGLFVGEGRCEGNSVVTCAGSYIESTLPCGSGNTCVQAPFAENGKRKASCVPRSQDVGERGFLGLPIVPPIVQEVTQTAELSRQEVVDLVSSGQLAGDAAAVCYSWWGGNEVPSGYCDERFWDGRWIMQVCANGIYDAPSRYEQYSAAGYCDGRYLYPKKGVVENISAVVTQVTAPVQQAATATCAVLPGWVGRAFGCQGIVASEAVMPVVPVVEQDVPAPMSEEVCTSYAFQLTESVPVPNSRVCQKDGQQHIECLPDHVGNIISDGTVLCQKRTEYSTVCSSLVGPITFSRQVPVSGEYQSCLSSDLTDPVQHYCLGGTLSQSQENGATVSRCIRNNSSDTDFTLPAIQGT